MNSHYHTKMVHDGAPLETFGRKKFPKDFAWHSPNGPFRETLERRALPPRLRFVSEARV